MSSDKGIFLCIAGSREFKNYKLFKLLFEKYIRPDIEQKHGDIEYIIDGVCPSGGVDEMANEYAKKTGLSWRRFPADWRKHGKAAGPIRNAEMAEHADVLWCYHIGGKGSTDVIKQFKKRGKPVIETRV